MIGVVSIDLDLMIGAISIELDLTEVILAEQNPIEAFDLKYKLDLELLQLNYKNLKN